VTSSVLINGRQTELDDGETVAGLLERLGLEAHYALVERNGEALPRERYAKVKIENGDRLVIARPVAGG
jgi:thiamine biosynthesis protein ThiS